MPLGSIGKYNFWSEKFWLPPNQTWEGVESPLFSDFQYGIFVSIVLSIMRILLCNYVFAPLGLRNGLRYRQVKRVPHNPQFEEYYLKNKRPSLSDIRILSKKFDISEVQISDWFRRKRNSAKFHVIVKFVESGLLHFSIQDFAVMFSHHVFTVTLIVFSFLTNNFRIGSVIMLLHDAADFWLEAAKMLKYVGRFRLCMFCFATFILVWILTRLYYFPVW
ncbi:unnamed protein product [Rodentolepis nana]|uniref:Homeobox domain-containing protein n=1 Tax=Rodentolepis nana TaxID=102285 RepID=A0A0R3TJI2_RODNA|nr:unnamed protein product [Rodentolepis nana]